MSETPKFKNGDEVWGVRVGKNTILKYEEGKYWFIDRTDSFDKKWVEKEFQLLTDDLKVALL